MNSRTTIRTIFVSLLLTSQLALAEVKTQDVQYKDGDVTLVGTVAWDESKLSNPAPGVLVIHQWLGKTEYEIDRAKQLAELGYIAFALDIYGEADKPKNMGEAGKAAGKFKQDITLFRKRLVLGLEQLKKCKGVDPNRLAAIGYCFGGSGAIELARSGADIDSVVSFHGGLDGGTIEDAKKIKAKLLICHGADDPFIKKEDLEAFKKTLSEADVDWEMIYYAEAVHSFTQPNPGSDTSRGAAYQANADRRSWQAMRQWFDETLN